MICCIVSYSQITFHHCLLFILGRWCGVRPLCFKVGGNRQHKASPCGCGRLSALSYSTCPTNLICRVKAKAGFNGQPMSHSVIKWLVKSACLFHRKFNMRQEPYDEAYTQGTPFPVLGLPHLFERIKI